MAVARARRSGNGRRRETVAARSRSNGTVSTRKGTSRRTRSWVRPLSTSRTVRWSKVMTAQARIATGYYDRKDVKEMVLEAVLKELARH